MECEIIGKISQPIFEEIYRRYTGNEWIWGDENYGDELLYGPINCKDTLKARNVELIDLKVKLVGTGFEQKVGINTLLLGDFIVFELIYY